LSTRRQCKAGCVASTVFEWWEGRLSTPRASRPTRQVDRQLACDLQVWSSTRGRLLASGCLLQV
ncbi:hypothetical protein J6590_108019, partial [Homalodisca vitripennis]